VKERKFDEMREMKEGRKNEEGKKKN